MVILRWVGLFEAVYDRNRNERDPVVMMKVEGHPLFLDHRQNYQSDKLSVSLVPAVMLTVD